MSSISHIPWNEHLDYAESEHDARMLVGDPKAMAWAWIYSYAKGLGGSAGWGDDDEDDYVEVTPEELIKTAMGNLETTDRWGGEYIVKGGLLEGVRVDPTFWDKLAILKDLDIPQDKRNNFFSCSC